MIRIRWTLLALEDLQGISSYIERERSLAAANRVCRAIYEAVQLLRRFPESGRAGMEQGTREWVVPAQPSYIVAYRIVHSEALEVLRIWHGAQQRVEEPPGPLANF